MTIDDPVEVIIGKAAQDCKSIGALAAYGILMALLGSLSEHHEKEFAMFCSVYVQHRLEELEGRDNG